MPTSNDMQSRANARALRKAQRDASVERSQTEAVTLSAASEAQEGDKPVFKPAAVNDAPVVKAKPKVSRAERTAVEKRRAEHQAQRDSEVSPEPVNIEEAVKRWDGTGNPPLHVLNAVAETLDKEVRDEGKVIAAAAAKGAYDVYLGRAVGKRSRHQNMRAQMAAGEAVIAAQRAKTDRNENA